MNLNSLLHARADSGNPVRVAVIGAGKFGSMFLSQALHHPGFHVVGVADLNPATAEKALINTGWPKERITRHSAAKALDQGMTFVTDDALSLIEHGGLEVVVEATGFPKSASNTRSPPSSAAAMWSWSMSKPTSWLAPCWPRRRLKWKSSIPWPTATSHP